MGTRDAHRETTQRAVLTAGLSLLARGGAEALTVRGLARELGLVPSALYRYVANRDDLLTILITHSYTDLANHVEVAHSQVPRADLRGRWRAIAHAIRSWARAHPHEYGLIFGTPIPGYQAPADQTVGPGTRVQLLFAQVAIDAEAAGLTPPNGYVYRDLAAQATEPSLEFLASFGIRVRPEWIQVGLSVWHLAMGTINSEIFGYLGPDTINYDAYFAAVVAIGELALIEPETSLDDAVPPAR